MSIEDEAWAEARKRYPATHDDGEDGPTTEVPGEDREAYVEGYLAGASRKAEVSDDMVERAARRMFDQEGATLGDYTWAEMVAEDPMRADLWRSDARVALSAALNPAS